MRFTSRMAAAGLVCAASIACSTTPGLELTATPNEVAGDGASPINLLVKLTRSGTPVSEGTVRLVATGGRFKDSTTVDGTTTEVQPGENTTVVLIAPRKGRGTIEVTATASLDGVALTKKATVKLKPAGGLASTLDFSCARQNIGAFVQGRTDPIHVVCTALAKDINAKPIPNASIETMAEAGRLQWLTDDASGQQVLVYTVDPGATPPKDVEPVVDAQGKTGSCPGACVTDPNSSGCIEPCWIDGGLTRNPRDGVATLVVAVPGVVNFYNEGEPFVDENDNGVRDATEPYIDFNGNGKYDPGDGQKGEGMVYKSVRIVWSGDAFTTNAATGSKFVKTSVNGTTAQMLLRLNDKNFNALAANGGPGQDQISFTAGTCTQERTLTLPASPLKLRQDTPGIKFRSDNGAIETPGMATSYRVGTDYTFAATVDAAPGSCDLSAQISRSYDPGAPPIFTSSGDVSTEEVQGSIAF